MGKKYESVWYALYDDPDEAADLKKQSDFGCSRAERLFEFLSFLGGIRKIGCLYLLYSVYRRDDYRTGKRSG